jgi:hypothetical protein
VIEQEPPVVVNSSFAHEDNNSNLQVGSVLLPASLEVDPGFLSFHNEGCAPECLLPNADGVRLWVKHFAPLNSTNGITVPGPWSDFFIKALLSPESFGWAKSFLESKAWEIILKEKASFEGFTFSIP